MLAVTYFPTHADNRMRSEGDVEAARESFLKQRPRNLEFLLRSRYEWMNAYLDGRETVIELGSGAGFAREFLTNPNLKLTDVEKRPWIDRRVDALDTGLDPESVDAVIASHMIHHLAHPVRFFEEAERILKPGGILVIQEIQTSLLMRFMLRVMRHEGWSYDIDVFDVRQVANDPVDPWSANCAIPDLLFRDATKFESHFPNLRVIKNEVNECLIFPLSGGVIAKTATFNLPGWALAFFHRLDKLLVRLFPSVCALGRSVVLEKRSRAARN